MPPLSESDLYARLAVRYQMPEWALFRQVCEAGTGGRRYMDALAMNLFPSRGMEVHGFEIKSARSDWLREKRDPAKADLLARFCDRWWVVAGDAPLVLDGELPAGWGLIVPRGEGLVTKVEAAKLEAEPLSRKFVATLLRRAQADERLSLDFQIETQVRRRVADEVEAARERFDRDLAKEREAREAFEAAAGVTLLTWQGARRAEEVGKALRAVLSDTGVNELLRRLRSQRASLGRLLQDFDALLAAEPEDAGETGTEG